MSTKKGKKRCKWYQVHCHIGNLVCKMSDTLCKVTHWRVGDWLKAHRGILTAVAAAGAIIGLGGGPLVAGGVVKVLGFLSKKTGHSVKGVKNLLAKGMLKLVVKGGKTYAHFKGREILLTPDAIAEAITPEILKPVEEKKACYIATHTYKQAPNEFYIVKSILPQSVVNSYYKISPYLTKLPKIIFLPLLESIRSIIN